MKHKMYGYVRVSSKDQCLARQLITMKKLGLQHIFIDKLSGKNFDRPAYRELLKTLKPKDVLVVSSIDCLGRDYEEIQKQWRLLTKEMDVDIVVLDMPLLDTRQKEGRDLTGTFIADLVLQILAYVAEIERKNIRERQRQGIEAAMARGVRFGRPNKKIPPAFTKIKDRWEKQQISSRDAARELGISQSTFLKWINENKS